MDRLDGGLGDDVYLVNRGDRPTMANAADLIVDSGGKDTLRFGAGISLAGIAASRANASDLLLDIGADRLLIAQDRKNA